MATDDEKRDVAQRRSDGDNVNSHDAHVHNRISPFNQHNIRSTSPFQNKIQTQHTQEPPTKNENTTSTPTMKMNIVATEESI